VLNVSITIDGKKISAPQNSTILDAAALAGIKIPTLCYMKDSNVKSNCRVCLVEVKGSRTFQPSCSTKVSEGMEIQTDTPEVRDVRKMSLELILSNHSWDCHHCLRIGNYELEELNEELCSFCFFCDCVKDGDCELQTLAKEYNVNKLPYAWAGEPYPLDQSTGAVVRNPNKCIKCRRCIETCTDVQTVNALSVVKRGNKLQVVPTLGKSLADSPCVRCGKCIESCPTGAIFAKEQFDEMLCTIRLQFNKKTIVNISSKIRTEIARLLEVDEASLDFKQIAAAFRKIGIDYVTTDEYAADRAMEDATKKLSDKLNGRSNGPVIISNSPSAIKFFNNEFTDLTDSLVTYPSNEQQFGQIAKSEWARENKIDPANVCTITLSENCSYKAEALLPEMSTDGYPNVDFVLTPREIARMFNKTAVDITKLEPCEFDSLGADKVARVDSLRSLLDNDAVQTDGVIAEMELLVNGERVKAAVAQNLGVVRRLLELVREGKSPYEIIRI